MTTMPRHKENFSLCRMAVFPFFFQYRTYRTISACGESSKHQCENQKHPNCQLSVQKLKSKVPTFFFAHTLRQTNIAMEHGPFEDVFPIEHGDIQSACYVRGNFGGHLPEAQPGSGAPDLGYVLCTGQVVTDNATSTIMITMPTWTGVFAHQLQFPHTRCLFFRSFGNGLALGGGGILLR